MAISSYYIYTHAIRLLAKKTMYRWASKRIEAHMKICVLALLFERIAELSCDQPCHHIRLELERVQVTEFFNVKYRVLMHNELSNAAVNVFKSRNITTPQQDVKLLGNR